ncbi:MAG: rubredoxin [Gammaproteobacteria bacterium]|nr:rubredoxin [Gammaproteobacteria bacterium]
MAKFSCPDCEFVYDEALGFEREGYASGTLFADLPEDFACPFCYVRDKDEFIALDDSD